jgi:U3 small nucleolar RNA-associated protein 4
VAGDETKLHQDVWAVTVLADGTMVTGDSGGNVQFWEAAFGTLITGFKRHGADVLAVAASPDGGSVFASGADPQVAIFRLVPPVEG